MSEYIYSIEAKEVNKTFKKNNNTTEALKDFSIKIKNKVDLNNTWYLKTAKIEKECTINLIKDIFDGCTYLFPLIHGILTSLSINFLTVPEKFPQRFFFDDIIAISFFVKQE